MRMSSLLCCGALAFASAAAPAADWRPDAAYLQAGPAQREAAAVQAGLAWYVPARWQWGSWEMRARGEVLLGLWRAENFAGGHQRFGQFALLPMVQFAPGGGASPWFVELGIGANLMDRYYRTPHIITVTRWAFIDVAGAGYRFGDRGEHVVGVRVTHISNGGLRQPNPGENFLFARYERRF